MINVTLAFILCAALCFIFFELRAIRKVLQARWDYDRLKPLFDLATHEKLVEKGSPIIQYQEQRYELLQRPSKLHGMHLKPCRQLSDSTEPDQKP